MSRQFKTGLVVGKFSPLHQGHELLVRYAQQHSQEVLIISYTKPEFACCPPDTRESWLIELFPAINRLVLDDARLEQHCLRLGISDFPVIPHNDDPADDHRQFVAWLCLSILNKPVDAVFTSEDYGHGFADSLTAYFQKHFAKNNSVQHICVDQQRKLIPISGTQVRSNPHTLRQFLSPPVYASFIERVCILGGESSGKTTLAKALAKRLNTRWVAEYGRELWDNRSGILQLEDMLHIARVQVQRENELARTASQFLICDTSPLTTLLYSRVMFNESDEELELLARRYYAHVFVCAPDFNFVQDGTRRDNDFRMYQHNWYLTVLNTRGIHYVLLEGSPEARLNIALTILETANTINLKDGNYIDTATQAI